MPMHPDSAVESTSEHAPWMPLEGLIGQWAAFAQEATTPLLSQAISYVFAALSSEQAALQSYHLATQYDQRCHTL
ncbi:MAG: hypothetical protein JO125_01485, partial [Chloroflexi bacterium]|nr:hypothetical protein [Chloroflexota bacterium]